MTKKTLKLTFFLSYPPGNDDGIKHVTAGESIMH